ncbi:hypothetical protein NMY22_g6606 [Coprinellus aureogranulatus]|nr:hypothetical protein NMY22_g6606 [Coprinellus aureogranulatus]
MSSKIEIELPEGYEEQPLSLPRSKGAPKVLQVLNHPVRLTTRLLAGNTYVFLMETSEYARAQRSIYEAKLILPGKDEKTLEAGGYIDASPGDLLLARDPTFQNHHPKDDAVIGWVTGIEHTTLEQREALDKATDAAIGPASERTQDSVRFEKLPGVKSVTGRCYTNGPTLQRPKTIIQPSATLAQGRDEGPTAYQDIVRENLEAVAPFAMNSFEAGPSCVSEAVKGQAEVIGIPRIGCDSNYAFPTFQHNVSGVQKHEENLDLEEHLGTRGKIHYDPGDHPGLLSSLVSNPRIPEGYHPGLFCLLYLGVFVRLYQYVVLNFSGRQAHVATAPSAPPGVDPAPHAVRNVWIGYPNRGMLDGSGIYQLSADRTGKDIVKFPPELVNYDLLWKCKTVIPPGSSFKQCDKCREKNRGHKRAYGARAKEAIQADAIKKARLDPAEEGESKCVELDGNSSPTYYHTPGHFFSSLRSLFKSGTSIDHHAVYHMESEIGVSHKEHVQAVASEIWSVTGYRFTVKDHDPKLKGGHKTRFWCSQDAARKRDPGLHRLNISCRDHEGKLEVCVKIRHIAAHVRYVDVAMPQGAIDMVVANMEWLRPGEMVTKIQAAFSGVTASQIHNVWREQSKVHWYRAESQLVSARILLEEHGDEIDIFDVTGVPEGVEILAWGMQNIAGLLKGRLVEVGMDATYNTNSKHMELYSIMGEYDNAGYPLCYCLLTTATAIDQDKRKKSLNVFISACAQKYNLSPTFCHVDKDMGEIAALRAAWPKAKIAVCWWHLRRAVRTRLANKKLATTPYNAPNGKQIDIKDYEGGLPEDVKPTEPSSTPATDIIPKLTIRLPPTQQQELTKSEPAPIASTPPPSDQPESTQSTNERRTFCVAEHREPIITMMERHFCAHPLIPGYAPPSSEGIRSWAVAQMYAYCVKNDLREVWAYLWENWYRRGRWELWARSAHTEIPVLKTTMILESHWRRIKHDFLHKFHMPRCDLLVWILVTKLVPTYYRKLGRLLVDTGRYREPASWRKDFKRRWRKLEKQPITLPLNEAYRPNTRTWTCTCPSFFVNRFLICKHLVQQVHRVPPRFFLEAKRQRTTPFWKHPDLRPLPDDDDVTDGGEDGGRIQADREEESGGSDSDSGGSDDESDDEATTFAMEEGLTFEEAMKEKIDMLKELAAGLEYQVQFRDQRFLRALDRELAGFTRVAKTCLGKERRMNSTRGSNPTTLGDSKGTCSEAVTRDAKKGDRLVLTHAMFKYCIAELQHIVREGYFSKRKDGAIVAFNGNVVKSDMAIPKTLRRALQLAVKPLEHLPPDQRDWHPGSHKTVVDLVHPSLYPLVYGTSKILAVGQKVVGLDECIVRCGDGRTLQADRVTNQDVTEPFSSKFQWLPCEVDISGDGAKITSYINNLHPKKNVDAYGVIEKVIDACIPSWELCLAPLYDTEFKFNQRVPCTTIHEEWAEFLDEAEDPEARYDRDESVIMDQRDFYDDIPSARSSFLPGHLEEEEDQARTSRTESDLRNDEFYDESYDHDSSTVYTEYDDDYSFSSGSDYDEQEGPRAIQPEPQPFKSENIRTPSAISFKHMYGRRGRPLQVVVKLESIELSPKRNKYPGRVWHLAGKQVSFLANGSKIKAILTTYYQNEHICASSMYFYSASNITPTRLGFRQFVDTEAINELEYEDGQHRFLRDIYGCQNGAPGVQNVGTIEVREGRLVTFPNIVQQQLQPFQLADKTRKGHLKILVLFLVDPNVRIISTANVPCQQMEWWKETLPDVPGANYTCDDATSTAGRGGAKKGQGGMKSVLMKGLAKLPTELKDHVFGQVDGFPMTMIDAKNLRTELMKERKKFVKKHWKELRNSNSFSLR